MSEVTAYLLSGAVFNKIGPRVTFISSYTIGIIGSLFYVLFSDGHESLIPFMVLGSKFGISSCFNCVYLANALFPPIYSSTTLGFFNFFARLTAMFAPIVAELKPKYKPMTIFCVMAALAAVVSFFLKTPKKEDVRASKVDEKPLLDNEETVAE